MKSVVSEKGQVTIPKQLRDPAFLVGVHARVQADRLLTRARGFFRHYFTDLPILDPPPHRRDQPSSTSVTGIDESTGRSRDDGFAPAASRCAPNAATIAPLSVHRPGRGTRKVSPAASQRS